MNHRLSHRIFLGLLAAFAIFTGTGAGEENTYLSPLALAAADSVVYIAEHTENQVALIDADTNKVTGIITVPGHPTGVALSPDGALLYVTLGSPSGSVCVVRLDDQKIVASHAVGHTPVAPAITPDGKTLFVCNQYDDTVMALDLAAPENPVNIPVSREPVAAAMTPDGTRLFVANLLPAGRADGDYAAASVDVIDVDTKKRTGAIKLPNGSASLLGICISPDGRYAYVTHILSRYQLPTTQLERGWVNTNALTIIDVAARKTVNTILLDDVDLGAANPWGVTCTDDGKWLCVAHSGTHELSVIDRNELHKKLADAAQGGEAENVPNDLAFLLDIRRRIALNGNGPRGLAAIGSRIFAAEYFSGTLAAVDLADDGTPRPQSIPLGAEPAMTAIRKGERFFHDGTVCFQQWQSCASCHPGGARVDALNWDLLNDGIGNPKNTKSLLLSYETPPTTATGVREDAVMSTRAGIRHILFNQVPETQAKAVDAYLKALKPVPSPERVKGALSPAAQRGKDLFESAQCANCHTPPLYTDLQSHRVGTGLGRESDTPFDTPTLVEIWRTAPYLHDGRAPTLKALLTTFNKDDLHGMTSTLSPEQIGDLVAYVRSL